MRIEVSIGGRLELCSDDGIRIFDFDIHGALVHSKQLEVVVEDDVEAFDHGELEINHCRVINSHMGEVEGSP